MTPGEDERGVGEIAGDLVEGVPEALDVGRVEVDRVPVRDADPVAARPPLALHGALDPALDLDRLETGPEEASRGSFEEALEQALEARQGSHGRPESSRGSARSRSATLTFGNPRRYLRRRVREAPCAILSPRSEAFAPIRVRPRAEGSMPEILTESFCERCGTRYTFEAAAPKGKRLGKLKTLSKGFVNFVSNDESSLDEAIAEARSEEQRELTNQQLDAFHQTFQFCMSCRQYTCANCWNEVESRCLSCSPLGADSLNGDFPAFDPLARIGFGQSAIDTPAANGNGAFHPEPTIAPAFELPATADHELPASADDHEPSSWPVADLPPGLPAPDAVEASAPDAVEATTDDAVEATSDERSATASEILTPAADAPVTEAIAAEAVAGEADADAGEVIDEDVALAVAAAAEHARHHAAAEAEEERRRQAAEAERLRAAELAAETERERRAEQERQAELAAEAEREHQAATLAAEAERQRQAEVAAEAERERQAADAAEAERQRQAADAAESERRREAELAARVERERQAELAAEGERERGAAEAAAAATKPAPIAARDDRVETPTWQIVAPDGAAEPTAAPSEAPPSVGPPIFQPAPPPPANGAASATNGAPAANGAPAVTNGAPPAGSRDWPNPATTPPPQWPMPSAGAAPQWPNRPIAGPDSDLWAASSQDVLERPGPAGVQSCVSCGLPLSASARFCRRCGTSQR